MLFRGRLGFRADSVIWAICHSAWSGMGAGGTGEKDPADGGDLRRLIFSDETYTIYKPARAREDAEPTN